MPRIRNAERRKKIIDQLLNSRTKIWNRDIFLKLVNERLDEGEISQSTLDKVLALINAQIQDLGISIRWVVCPESLSERIKAQAVQTVDIYS
jgi:hypothetical protein